MRFHPKKVQVEEADKEDQEQPNLYLAVNVSEQKRKDLEAWISMHLNQIEKEMQPILSRFQTEDDQVEGNMPGSDYPYSGAFRVNYPLTKKKIREIANRVKQAYLDSDPVWGVDIDDPSLFELAVKIEKSLDSAMDNDIDEEDDLSLCLFEAVKHGVGALIPTWIYHEERVRQLETWKAFDGASLESLTDLIQFEDKYPNWREDKSLRKIHSLLSKGTDAEREVIATKPVINRPDFQHVEAKNLRVYPGVKGYEGLRTTPIYGFITKMTRFQLEAFADDETIERERLDRILPGTRDDEEDANAQTEEFDIFQGTLRYDVEDKGQTRCKFWYAVKEQALLRIRYYPWWYHESDLIPFYTKIEEPGFFKKGFAHDVVDEHTILNVLLNLYLNAIDMANSMRWKAKYKSIGHAYLLSRRWSPHVPMPWKDDPNEVEPNAHPMNHLGHIVTGLELMRRQSDEATGTSSLQSGRESPTDPSAPATKTIALLQQVQPNEKDILRSLNPSFRQMGVWILYMYFQGLKMGWIDEMPDGLRIQPDILPFIADNIHPRAILFEFDRQGRFERNANLMAMTQKIIGQARPDVILKMLRITISQADSQWARLVDTLDLENPQAQAVVPEAGSLPAPSTNGGSQPNPEELLQGQSNRIGAAITQ